MLSPLSSGEHSETSNGLVIAGTASRSSSPAESRLPSSVLSAMSSSPSSSSCSSSSSSSSTSSTYKNPSTNTSGRQEAGARRIVPKQSVGSKNGKANTGTGSGARNRWGHKRGGSIGSYLTQPKSKEADNTIRRRSLMTPAKSGARYRPVGFAVKAQKAVEKAPGRLHLEIVFQSIDH